MLRWRTHTSRTSSSSGAGASATETTVRLTVHAPASGTSSSRHQHSPGSYRCTSKRYGGSSTSTSPIHEVTTSNASNASAGSAEITNDGASCWARSVVLVGAAGSAGVAGAAVDDDAFGASRSDSWLTSCASTARYAALMARISWASPPRSGWLRKARRRRATRASSSVAERAMPSTSNGSDGGVITPFERRVRDTEHARPRQHRL